VAPAASETFSGPEQAIEQASRNPRRAREGSASHLMMKRTKVAKTGPGEPSASGEGVKLALE
jgi:hypothetical protein